MQQGLNTQICKPGHSSLISINTLPTKRHFWIGIVAPLTKAPDQPKLPHQSRLPHFTICFFLSKWMHISTNNITMMIKQKIKKYKNITKYKQHK